MADGRIEASVFIKDEFSHPLDDLQDGLSQSCEFSEDFNDTLDKFGGQTKNFNVLGKSADMLKDKCDGVRDSINKMSNAWRTVKDKSDTYFNSVSGKSKELTENITALYGQAGLAAMQSYAKFAEENGWDTGEVVKAGAKANRYGLGQDTTQMMLKLADRFGMITGESIGDMMDTLMSSVEGKSASSAAALLGGGEGVERDLQRQGYERMLRTGNVQAAMKILEQVANKYGRTAEAAERAAKSTGVMSGILIQKMTNAATRIKGSFLKSIDPAINKLVTSLTKALDSEAFQSVLTGIEKAFGFIASIFGTIVNAVTTVIDFFMSLGGSAAKVTAAIILAKSALAAIGGILLKSAIFKLIKHLLFKIPLIKSLAGKAISFILGGVKKLGGLILKVLGGALRMLAGAILRHPIMLLGTLVMFGLGMAAEAFGDFNSQITGEAGGMISNVIGMISYGIGVFVANCQNLVATVVNAFKSMWETLVNTYEDLVDGFARLFPRIKNAFFDKISGAINFVLDKFKSLANFLGQDGVVKIIEEMQTTASSALATSAIPEPAVKRKRYQAEKWQTVNAHEAGTDMMKKTSGFAKFLDDKLGGIMGVVSTEHEKDREITGKLADDTGKIRGMMTEEQEVAWLKELGERQYINKLNVESPKNTFNIAIKTGKDMNAADMRKEMERMVESQRNSGGFGVSINQRLQPA